VAGTSEVGADRFAGVGDLAWPSRPGGAETPTSGGQWSIRIDDQWRICFTWPEGSTIPSGVKRLTTTDRRRRADPATYLGHGDRR